MTLSKTGKTLLSLATVIGATLVSHEAKAQSGCPPSRAGVHTAATCPRPAVIRYEQGLPVHPMTAYGIVGGDTIEVGTLEIRSRRAEYNAQVGNASTGLAQLYAPNGVPVDFDVEMPYEKIMFVQAPSDRTYTSFNLAIPRSLGIDVERTQHNNLRAFVIDLEQARSQAPVPDAHGANNTRHIPLSIFARGTYRGKPCEGGYRGIFAVGLPQVRIEERIVERIVHDTIQVPGEQLPPVTIEVTPRHPHVSYVEVLAGPGSLKSNIDADIYGTPMTVDRTIRGIAVEGAALYAGHRGFGFAEAQTLHGNYTSTSRVVGDTTSHSIERKGHNYSMRGEALLRVQNTPLVIGLKAHHDELDLRTEANDSSAGRFTNTDVMVAAGASFVGNHKQLTVTAGAGRAWVNHNMTFAADGPAYGAALYGDARLARSMDASIRGEYRHAELAGPIPQGRSGSVEDRLSASARLTLPIAIGRLQPVIGADAHQYTSSSTVGGKHDISEHSVQGVVGFRYRF
jgi:hypothetical protein